MIEASLPLDEEILENGLGEQCTRPLDKEIVIVADVADYVRRLCHRLKQRARWQDSCSAALQRHSGQVSGQ